MLASYAHRASGAADNTVVAACIMLRAPMRFPMAPTRFGRCESFVFGGFLRIMKDCGFPGGRSNKRGDAMSRHSGVSRHCCARRIAILPPQRDWEERILRHACAHKCAECLLRETASVR